MTFKVPSLHADYKSVMIAWTPRSDRVRSGTWPDETGWSDGYMMTGGACYRDVRNMPELVAKAYLVNLFNTLVIRDQVDPIAAHKALCGVTEFRQAINLQCPGAIE